MRREPGAFLTRRFGIVLLLLLLSCTTASAQTASPAATAGPIALVSTDNKDPGAAASVTGSLEVAGGKAMIGASGSVTAGTHTANVTLPRRGVLRVCASTTVKLAEDTSAPAGDKPGLMMALDRGALEMSFASGSSADVLLTPDFRILVSGPGAVDLKVRLSGNGDTCVDNAGINAPYVLVTSVFGSANYRVKPGQRVMFQHGSLEQVVDNEKEPCGCPPAETGANAFPMAESAGLAPMAKPETAPAAAANQPTTAPLVYKGDAKTAEPLPAVQAPETVQATTTAPTPVKKVQEKSAQKKSGFFGKIGRFFRRIFGAE
ncbi:MAG TPA: hypothetical protein VG844_05720 [Terracidiphilus sp.]|nr:hypothetical protein [Terracidiphilus sp.]